jgi:hypothetical protein
MPCGDGGVPYPPTREEILGEKTAQYLCGIVKVLEGPNVNVTLDRVLRHVDWKEAGVTRAEFTEWWDLHKRRDAERKAREEREAHEAAERERIEKTLNPEQRRLLKKLKK